ncbi:hypothetical protein VTN77DRAFT_3525 [Rasamsonia byssochlamydoides]|uniref:uncharacterized protein n=1 Tax=Rasamsonia byssochlamydoides TaxID=89139 RepID=UPI0037449E54
MIRYFSQQPGILAPLVLACYNVQPQLITFASDVVPGVSLDKVWHQMTQQQRESIRAQLKEQPTMNFYERLKLGFEFMGPWPSEEEFDNWCLARVKSPLTRAIWKHLLPRAEGGLGAVRSAEVEVSGFDQRIGGVM